MANGENENHEEQSLRDPIYKERQMRIICIGAGASGLIFAYKLQRSFENFSFTVYEKNKEISGTWYENKYPGCACDVAAHNYTWSFEPKPDWSAVYASSAEIFTYFSDFADKYHLRQHIKTEHQIIASRWNDEAGMWDVEVKDLVSGAVTHDSCNVLINAGGILNNWKWPQIRGFELFKGPKLHTANWDDSVDLSGKRIGLIGNGSSGVQVLPAILPRVKEVTQFIRKGSWIAPPLRGIEQHKYTEQELEDFAKKPGLLLEHRKKYQTSTSGVFNLFIRDSKTQKDARKTMEEHMREKLQDPRLEKLLIPNWSVGCRRLTPGVAYLESLSKENVHLVVSGIEEITPTGCLCEDNTDYEFDVLVCATGFDVSFKPRFPLLGRDEKDLRDVWANEAKGYMGLAAPDMPNYFVFLGPNCPIGNGPILAAIEAQADYMLKWCDRWQTENIKSFTPKWTAVEDFVAHSDKFMRGTVWTEDCSSWYKGNSVTGRVSALWPGSTLHYIEALSVPRGDDFDVVYSGNRFAWMGNGFSQIELDLTSDWAYYIKETDDSDFLSRGKQRKILSKSGSKSGASFKVV